MSRERLGGGTEASSEVDEEALDETVEERAIFDNARKRVGTLLKRAELAGSQRTTISWDAVGDFKPLKRGKEEEFARVVERAAREKGWTVGRTPNGFEFSYLGTN